MKNLTIKNLFRTSGVTLVEILVAVAILGILSAVWMQSMPEIFKTASKGQKDYQLAQDQLALSSIVEAIGADSAIATFCAYRHPWGSYSAGSCETTYDTTHGPVKDSYVKGWQNLSDAVIKWPQNSPTDEKKPESFKLGAAYFNQTIVPLLTDAGCVRCHSANDDQGRNWSSEDRQNDLKKEFPNFSYVYMKNNRPDLLERDFTNYDHVVNTFVYNGQTRKPIATRAVLASSLGRSLLRTEFQYPNILSGSRAVDNTVKFERESVIYKSTPYFPMAIKGPQSTGTQCANPGLVKCADPVNDIMVQNSCNDHCLKEEVNICSCGKDCQMVCPGQPYKCTLYEPTWTCLSTMGLMAQDKPGLDGSLGGAYTGLGFPIAYPGPMPQGKWEAVADTTCTTIGESNNFCMTGKMCEFGVTPNKQTPICIKPGTCQRKCDLPTHGPLESCGKDCFHEGAIIACSTQTFHFECNAEKSETVNVLKYYINSSTSDPTTGVRNSIQGVGIVQ